MKTAKIAAVLGALCLPLAALPTPVFAATAHNSQAGAAGPTTNNDAPAGMTKRVKPMSGKPMTKKGTMKKAM